MTLLAYHLLRRLRDRLLELLAILEPIRIDRSNPQRGPPIRALHGRRIPRRRSIWAVPPHDGGKEVDGVLDGSAHRSRDVKVGAYRNDALVRDRPEGGLDCVQSVPAGWADEGSVGLGADGNRCHAGGCGDATPRGGPSRALMDGAKT
jgi:hypothetical protein